MTLRDGTPSVPSSAIGKPTVSPALASILAEVVRTASGAMGWGSGVCAIGGAIAPVEANQIPPRMTHGTHAADRRPAISQHVRRDRKSTRLNYSHLGISYAVFCLK